MKTLGWYALAFLLFCVASVCSFVLALATGLKGPTQVAPLLLAMAGVALFSFLSVKAIGQTSAGSLTSRLIQVLVCQLVVVIGTVVFWPVYASSRQARMQFECLSNAKQLAIGLIEYSMDHDDCFPPAERWRTLTDPTLLKEPLSCPLTDAQWDHALNESLSAASIEDINDGANTVMVFESSGDVPNLYGTLSDAVPHNGPWCTFATCDGHANRVDTVALRKLTWKITRADR